MSLLEFWSPENPRETLKEIARIARIDKIAVIEGLRVRQRPSLRCLAVHGNSEVTIARIAKIAKIAGIVPTTVMLSEFARP